jgi:excinuclease UvrABC nuclease subunit
MTEWQSITRMGINIPDDDGEVTIENYKTVEKKGAIYKIFNHAGKLMYIGQTENLRRRLSEHFIGKRKGYFIEKVQFFYVEFEDEFVTRTYLDMFETYLIRKLKPRYNVHQTAPMRYLK